MRRIAMVMVLLGMVWACVPPSNRTDGDSSTTVCADAVPAVDAQCHAPSECPETHPCMKAGIALSGGVGWLREAVLTGSATEVDEAIDELIERAEVFDSCQGELVP